MGRVATLITTLVIVAVLFGYTGAVEFTADNTVIVLPTTKVVNNTPLHINEDAISGSILGSWIEWNSLKFSQKTVEHTVSFSVHSVPFWLDSGVYYLLNDKMPDFGVNLSVVPTNHSISIPVNFSLIHKGKDYVNVTAGSLKVVFTTNYSPVSLGINGKYIVANDNVTELFAYDYTSDNKELVPVGSSIEIDGWKVTILDVSPENGELLLKIVHPTGESENVVAHLGNDLVFYVENGKFYTTTTDEILEKLKSGVDKLVDIHFASVFIGQEYKLVNYSYKLWEFDKSYSDGSVYKGKWVWNIIDKETFELVYNANTTLKDGDKIEYPFGNVYLTAHIKNGTATFTFEKIYKKNVSVKTIDNVYLPKPYNLIINDTKAVNSLPAENIIVVGGWVSNKFWSVIEKNFPDKVSEIKKEIMNNGYAVEFLPNPVNKNCYIVILAGKTYVETRKAVESFITTYILSGGGM